MAIACGRSVVGRDGRSAFAFDCCYFYVKGANRKDPFVFSLSSFFCLVLRSTPSTVYRTVLKFKFILPSGTQIATNRPRILHHHFFYLAPIERERESRNFPRFTKVNRATKITPRSHPHPLRQQHNSNLQVTLLATAIDYYNIKIATISITITDGRS